MAIVTDPDDLDRWQILVDPVAETISIRGLGTERHAADATGDSDGTTTFTDGGANFTTDGVTAGDILTIISDPSNDGGIIGHYEVQSVGTTTLVVDRAIPASSAADLDYKINSPPALGGSSPNVADGVTKQAEYSFLKEEWRVKDGTLPTNAEDLIKYPFPLEPITREQFIMGSGSTGNANAFTYNEGFAQSANSVNFGGTTRQLIRTAGWQELDASGVVQKEYAGNVTLGALDSDAQVYYLQHAATADPTNFVLTGPVNQSINTLDWVTPADTGTGFAITGNNTISRNDGGNWATDGYVAGGQITIRNAEDPANDGTWTIVSVQDAVDGDLVVTGGLTNNASDTTLEAAVDKRAYLKLFVRKKGRTYASSQISDIGVTTIETIVNRFPLAHTRDPAIVDTSDVPNFFDGSLAGDGVNDVFQAVESFNTGTDGATSDNGDGTFTFTSAGSTFNAQARTVDILQPFDTVEIESGIAGEQGVYVIKSVDGANTLTLYNEPTVGAMSSQSSLSFTTRTRTKDTGAANATLADVDGNTGTLTSAGSTFGADNGLGDRVVTAGDMVVVSAGTGAVIGVYKVISQDSATQLTLNTSDQPFSGETSQTYRVVRAGMYLQRFSTSLTHVGPDGGTGFDFNDANPDTIDRNDGGDWTTDGYNLPGLMLTVTNATLPGNDQVMIVASATSGTITLIAEEAVVADTLDTTAEFDGEYGIIRTINGIAYPFHWRLFANGGSLSEIFQWLQWRLRLANDIDRGNGTQRGDTADLLMTFASPNGVTLDLYPDNHDAGDANNVTYVDMSGDSRNNAFLTAVNISVPDFLINATNKRLIVFFADPDGTPSSGDEFGTPGAIVVDDNLGVDMDTAVVASSPVQFTFDYTNNNQGGRTPDTNAAIVIVALGDDSAQFAIGVGTILKQNTNVFSVANAQERVYSNP